MNPAQGPWLMNVDERDFANKVVQESQQRPVVVDFWAPWCAPCRALAPILEKVIGEQRGAIQLAKVNIDETPNLAAQFQIQGIPLVIAFRKGAPAAEFAGVQSELFVRQFVEKLLPSEAEKLAAEAKAIETSDPARAELTYLQALDRDRNNEAAAQGLARIMLSRGQFNEALAILEDLPDSVETAQLRAKAGLLQLAMSFESHERLLQRVQSEPTNAAARYEYGVALAVQEKYADALEMLLSAAESDAKLASSKVREAMVKVFDLVGPQCQIANEYRNKLSTLLY